MFNRETYVTVRGGSAHNTTTVTEKRAPTDESIKLLDEFQERAKSRVIATALADVPSIETKISFARSLDESGFFEVLNYKCKLNGKVFTGHVKIDTYSDKPLEELVVEHLAKNLASRIVFKLIQNHDARGMHNVDVFKK